MHIKSWAMELKEELNAPWEIKKQKFTYFQLNFIILITKLCIFCPVRTKTDSDFIPADQTMHIKHCDYVVKLQCEGSVTCLLSDMGLVPPFPSFELNFIISDVNTYYSLLYEKQ